MRIITYWHVAICDSDGAFASSFIDRNIKRCKAYLKTTEGKEDIKVAKACDNFIKLIRLPER